MFLDYVATVKENNRHSCILEYLPRQKPDKYWKHRDENTKKKKKKKKMKKRMSQVPNFIIAFSLKIPYMEVDSR